jgi:DNA-directed RNA polymerase specialized sigma24 family protein
MKVKLSELEYAQLHRKHKKKLKRDKIYAKLHMELPDLTEERYKMELDKWYNAVPIEKKQVFLDHLWDGKKLGEAAQLADISMEIAHQVIIRNIEKIMARKVTE